MARPQADEYSHYFEPYISLTKYETVNELIANYSEDLINFIEYLPNEKAGYAYESGKWTVKEVLQHIIDIERVFAYRALAIARGDQQPLPGVDQNDYYLFQRSGKRAFEDMKEEFKAMRYNHNILFRSFDSEALEAKGRVLGNITSCRSWIYACFGHALHHINVYKQRYGIENNPWIN